MSADRVPPPMPAGPPNGGAFGDLLRRSREAQRIALEDVATRTRIARHHLEALERSDLDALPAGPFARSYVRAYAEVLGIDPEPVLEAHRAQERRRGVDTPEGERRMLQEMSQLVGHEGGGPSARLRASPGRLVLAVVSGVLLGAAGWLVARQGSRGIQVHAPARPMPAPARPTPVASAQPPARVVAPSPAPRSGPTGAATGRRAREESATTDAPAVSPPTDSLEVSGFGAGTGVADRRLVGRADRFPEGSRVVFWTEVVGGRPGHVIRHVWFREGRAVMRAALAIRGPHWRTHSTLVLPAGSAGGWTVEARTSDGRLLARNDFLCEPREARPAR